MSSSGIVLLLFLFDHELSSLDSQLLNILCYSVNVLLISQLSSRLWMTFDHKIIIILEYQVLFSQSKSEHRLLGSWRVKIDTILKLSLDRAMTKVIDITVSFSCMSL